MSHHTEQPSCSQASKSTVCVSPRTAALLKQLSEKSKGRTPDDALAEVLVFWLVGGLSEIAASQKIDAALLLADDDAIATAIREAAPYLSDFNGWSFCGEPWCREGVIQGFDDVQRCPACAMIVQLAKAGA